MDCGPAALHCLLADHLLLPEAKALPALVEAGALGRGEEASRLLNAFLTQAAQGDVSASDHRERFASVWPAPPTGDGEERLTVRGTVLVRVRGRVGARAEAAAGEPGARTTAARPAALAGIVDSGRPSAGRDLFALLRQDGLVQPVSLAIAFALASLLVVVEALFFRGLLDLGAQLSLPEQRAGAAAVLLLFLASVLAVELPGFAGSLAAGRRHELRLRWPSATCARAATPAPCRGFTSTACWA